ARPRVSGPALRLALAAVFCVAREAVALLLGDRTVRFALVFARFGVHARGLALGLRVGLRLLLRGLRFLHAHVLLIALHAVAARLGGLVFRVGRGDALLVLGLRVALRAL